MNPLDTDTRVTCNTCRNRSAGWCTDAIRAGLSATRNRQEVGSMLAALKQQCAAYTPRVKK